MQLVLTAGEQQNFTSQKNNISLIKHMYICQQQQHNSKIILSNIASKQIGKKSILQI
jgi:hypothetical protein